MKVTFLKNHLNYKAKSKAEVSDSLGQYWINCGVAKKTIVKKKASAKK